MMDWADVLAAEFVNGITNNTTNASIIAMQLRAQKDYWQTVAIKEATKQIEEVFAKQSIGGGDK